MDIGSIVARRYRVKSPIGQGGMGQVWMAHDEHLARPVALKTMTSSAARTADATKDARRFEREAKAMARLDHIGLAAVYDLGEDAGIRYLAMQYIQGHDLRDLIAERGHLSVTETAAIAVQVCSVLAAAHSLRIVHRDLKPGNIRVRTDGLVKVLDFGVAADLDPDATHLTTTGQTLGTWLYMAPEQVAAEPIDHRADLYALGCLIHEMLSGRPPFTDPAPLKIPDMHLTTPPTPLREIAPGIPEEIEHLVLELLAKKPDDRPAHAGEVYRRLAPWLPDRLPAEAALLPWVDVDPCRPFTHPMAPGARPVRDWARSGNPLR